MAGRHGYPIVPGRSWIDGQRVKAAGERCDTDVLRGGMGKTQLPLNHRLKAASAAPIFGGARLQLRARTGITESIER